LYNVGKSVDTVLTPASVGKKLAINYGLIGEFREKITRFFSSAFGFSTSLFI
jgi:hypothetical protein